MLSRDPREVRCPALYTIARCLDRRAGAREVWGAWGRTPVLRPTSTSACGPGGPAQTWRSAPHSVDADGYDAAHVVAAVGLIVLDAGATAAELLLGEHLDSAHPSEELQGGEPFDQRVGQAAHFVSRSHAKRSAAVARFPIEADAIALDPPAMLALVEAAVVAFPAAFAVPVVGVMAAVIAGDIRQAAEDEPLIGFAVDVVGLDSGAVTGGCVGDVQGLAETVGDEGIAVVGRRDAPLLAGATGEWHAAHGRAVARAHGLQRGPVHDVAENPESAGLGGHKVPLLVIGVARRELDDGGLVVAVQVDYFAGSDVGDFVAARPVESVLRPRGEGDRSGRGQR